MRKRNIEQRFRDRNYAKTKADAEERPARKTNIQTLGNLPEFRCVIPSKVTAC